MAKEQRNIEPGTPIISNNKISIEIQAKGPYFVYGNPPLQQLFMTPDEEDISWEYRDGKKYPTDREPIALCRCGFSKNHPYCDGAHQTADWDPTLTADNVPLLENAEVIDGPTLQLIDNENYCAFARFCDAKGRVWNLVEISDDPTARDYAIHDTVNCPAGRLKIWDKKEEKFIEPDFKPALGLIEDPQEGCSGPLWVRGGIPVNDSEGTKYELRNRVTLCRCGASSNKPFCDGTHASVRFDDGLPNVDETE